jgi:DNA-binding transcriptional regulator YdaS (Cro superfamily)
MKKFLDFLNELPMDGRDDFAKRCDTTFDYLRQIGYGNRPCREALAMKIERESKGAVTCEELCPDVPWSVVRCPLLK